MHHSKQICNVTGLSDNYPPCSMPLTMRLKYIKCWQHESQQQQHPPDSFQVSVLQIHLHFEDKMTPLKINRGRIKNGAGFSQMVSVTSMRVHLV